MRTLKLSALMSLLLCVQSAWSDPIFYEVENVGGDTWQYTYTAGNETGGPIEWFTIWFDPALSILDFAATFSGPDGWDILIAGTDPLFPGPEDDQFGFYDAFALFTPLGPGELLGGFTVVFDWLGGPGTTPGAQLFTLNGLLIGDGPDMFTQPLPTISVPEPGTLLLLSSGLLAMALHRRRRPTPGQLPVA